MEHIDRQTDRETGGSTECNIVECSLPYGGAFITRLHGAVSTVNIAFSLRPMLAVIVLEIQQCCDRFLSRSTVNVDRSENATLRMAHYKKYPCIYGYFVVW